MKQKLAELNYTEIDYGKDKEYEAENEAIKQTLDAFNLGSDYTKFELELTFQNGTKIEFKDEK